jgi:hypothetical protein
MLIDIAVTIQQMIFQILQINIFLKKLLAIALLMSVLVQGPVQISRIIQKQYFTEESETSSKETGISELSIHFLSSIKGFHLQDTYYSITKEKFSHFHEHPSTIEWLETFSPPPELS